MPMDNNIQNSENPIAHEREKNGSALELALVTLNKELDQAQWVLHLASEMNTRKVASLGPTPEGGEINVEHLGDLFTREELLIICVIRNLSNILIGAFLLQSGLDRLLQHTLEILDGHDDQLRGSCDWNINFIHNEKVFSYTNTKCNPLVVRYH